MMDFSIPFVRRRIERTHRHTLPGAEPGTLTPRPGAVPPTLHVIAYSGERVLERTAESPEELTAIIEEWPVTWIDIDGLGDLPLLQRVAKVLALHPLALEDVMTSHQRSKVEQYEDYKYIVVRMASREEGQLVTEQLNIFLGEHYVVTIQERPGGDCLDPIRERIRKGRGRIRGAGTDYLAYALIDTVIDNYFPLIERYGDTLEDIEAEVVESPTKHTPAKILGSRHDLMLFRRAIWPLREALNALLHDDVKLIGAETRVYMRDCYDHTIQLIDMVETYREIAGGLMDVYLSSVSNRMNEVMKVLTIIATIFIPLTFITSLYGMNFDPHVSPWNMPGARFALRLPDRARADARHHDPALVLFQEEGLAGRRGSPAQRRARALIPPCHFPSRESRRIRASSGFPAITTPINASPSRSIAPCSVASWRTQNSSAWEYTFTVALHGPLLAPTSTVRFPPELVSVADVTRQPPLASAASTSSFESLATGLASVAAPTLTPDACNGAAADADGAGASPVGERRQPATTTTLASATTASPARMATSCPRRRRTASGPGDAACFARVSRRPGAGSPTLACLRRPDASR